MSRSWLLVVVASIGIGCSALDKGPEELALEISHETMSPFCTGLTLHDCPSTAAINLREEIETWAADGMTQTEIKDRLVAQYGESVLAVPQDNSWLIFAIPGAVLVGGLLIATFVAKRWRREGFRMATGTDPSFRTAEEQGRLDAAVAEVRNRQPHSGPGGPRR